MPADKANKGWAFPHILSDGAIFADDFRTFLAQLPAKGQRRALVVATKRRNLCAGEFFKGSRQHVYV